MGFTVRREPNGVVVVGVDGQLIVSNRHELKERVAEAVDFGSRKILVDFTSTGYIDSSGLGALVSLAKKLREAGGELRLADLQDLRDYCYVVAGIVGEMLTELYLLGRSNLAPIAETLRARSRWFGEGLQLVNILKDSSFDATEGRSYLPRGLDRDEVFALARRDLRLATEYVLALQSAGAERGLVASNALPVLLAYATVERVEEAGPGAKITRDQVRQLVEMTDYALDHGLPVLSLDDD